MNVTDLPQACISLIENVPGIDFIDEDFAIFDNIDDIPSLDHPMRIDAVVWDGEDELHVFLSRLSLKAAE